MNFLTRILVVPGQIRQISTLKTTNVFNIGLKLKNSYHPFNYKLCSRRISNTNDVNDDIEDDGYQQLINRYFHVPQMGHQVLVIQPYVKWGPTKKQNTTPELQLSEAVSLIGTLKKWQVVEEVIY
jgi:hypothetical protein